MTKEKSIDGLMELVEKFGAARWETGCAESENHPAYARRSDASAANLIAAIRAYAQSLVQPDVDAPAQTDVRMLTSDELDDLVRDAFLTGDSARGMIKRAAYKAFEVNALKVKP
jgi:hypothetical protein